MTRGLGAIELLQRVMPEWLYPAAEAVTHLGDTALFVVVLTLVYWFGDRYGLVERRDDGALLVGLALGALSLVLLLKGLFGLPRPPDALMLVHESGYGFPSGHALGSTAIWGGLALLAARGRRRTRLAAGAVLVGLVALSRVVLGVHYLVDVVAGAAVGVVFLGTVLRFADGDPRRAFGVAVAIAALALVVDGTADAGIAFGGAVGGLVAWQVVREQPTDAVTPGVAAVALAVLGGLAVLTYAVPVSVPVATVVNVVVVAGIVGLPALVARVRTSRGSAPSPTR